MSSSDSECVGTIWKRLTLQKPDGTTLNLCFMDLPRDRVEEFIEFQMKYFVTREVFHQIAGIPDSKEAMAEYRQILEHIIKDPSSHNIICCLEHNTGTLEILAGQILQLIKRGDPCSDEDSGNFNTKEVKLFLEFVRHGATTYPIPDLMKEYDLQCYISGQGLAVHPDYTRLGIATQFYIIRRMICQARGIPVSGGWLSSLGTQKAAAKSGWITKFEISREPLEKILNVKCESTPPSIKYMIVKIE